jgi:hypothetical protein
MIKKRKGVFGEGIKINQLTGNSLSIFLISIFGCNFAIPFSIYKTKIFFVNVIPFLIKELEQEAKTTRKFLKLVNPDKFQWKPHEKSMDMKRLCVHIAELPAWIDLAVNTDGIDFAAGDYKPTEVSSTQDLLDLLDRSEKKALDALQSVSDEDLLKT